jgi:hypothetical protein
MAPVVVFARVAPMVARVVARPLSSSTISRRMGPAWQRFPEDAFRELQPGFRMRGAQWS